MKAHAAVLLLLVGPLLAACTGNAGVRTDTGPGAGDTVIAVLGLALAAGHGFAEAMTLSNLAAGLVVALSPSQVLWSSVVLRESTIWVLLVGIAVILGSDPGANAPRHGSPPEGVQLNTPLFRQLLNMDPPEHRKVRKVASPWFTPRALRRIDAAVDESAEQLVDALARNDDGQADLATEIAIKHPLRILSTALGVPRDQEATILNLSTRLFAPDDEEIGGGTQPEDFNASTAQKYAAQPDFILLTPIP